MDGVACLLGGCDVDSCGRRRVVGSLIPEGLEGDVGRGGLSATVSSTSWFVGRGDAFWCSV